MRDEEKLLREYVNALLEEEGGGETSATNSGDGFYSYGLGGFGGGMGGGFGGGSATLLKPASDLFKVIKGVAKKIGSSLWYLAKLGLSSLIQTLTFGLFEAKFGKMRDDYKRSIGKINSEISQAVGDSWRSIANNDLVSIAVLYNPIAYFGVKAVSESRVIKEIRNDDPIIQQGKDAARWTVETYFAGIEAKVQEISEYKSIEDLPQDLQAEADEQIKEKQKDPKFDKVKAEKNIMLSLRKSLFDEVVKMLDSDKQSIESGLRELKASKRQVYGPDSLVSRYDEMIKKISAMS